MKAFTATALALVAPATALLRFPCAQLVIDRLDPLVTPGQAPSPHLHQILGGNSFNVTMDPEKDMPEESTCTSCQFSEDFSNYWTAVLYFKARNGTYKRVPQIPNSGFNGVNGGMTVYYMQDGLYNFQQTSKVQAFQPGFRMFIGDVNARTKEEAERFRQLTFTCLDNINTRDPQTLDFPTQPCKTGIMTAVRFPTCWDGVNLDSPDHMAHMSYPEFGSFESGGPCPASHPVRMGQLFYEVIWDTSKFNNKADWPEDGSQPFVWSFGDGTGYANHGDYLFGWQGDALQRALDSPCYQNCPTLKTQNAAAMNKCTVPRVVKEEIDAWVSELPGGHQAQYVKKRWTE
ncbi:hypothetical protein AA0113_g11023 [Alternaria arborescens]|uniref:DUF1996 domain-containing protein n=1 Tax=Alternaria arborescens TaxID=156630 RepID=A0A4Q4QGQ9_9PLEO|nr:hypothetical protein AA0111_g4738 [Alternaria arborescens]RYN37992.1 hypothetical protein AA0112_g4101 [Alternaria arborescens]RYO31579.1 hypothetical protein AA0111_g4738 [Alternaria arborescens]RYO41480.1 hypothetical protein AA0113_g11023 [Alternaria arborescens]